MKVALLSDIHGNLWALEAVLAHAAAQGVTTFWNLGDILSGPLDAAGTADRLLALGALTIAGNHERQLLDCARAPGIPSDEHAFHTTTPAHREWLRSLPATARPRPDVLLCHGTPHSDVQPLLETHERGRGLRMASHDEVLHRLRGPTSEIATEATNAADDAALASHRAFASEATRDTESRGGSDTRDWLASARLIVCGHTHLPRVTQVGQACLIVNPGSVGLQGYDYAEDGETHYVDNGAPHASYAIVEEIEVLGAPRRWQASLHRIPYDWERAAIMAARNKRPEWAFALRTGFALRA